jgi:Mg/Co/Ni transporter MgtE
MSETVNEAREALSGSELQELWSSLASEARLEAFKALSRAEAEDVFWNLSAPDQVALLLALPAVERRGWMRLLAPDDAADRYRPLRKRSVTVCSRCSMTPPVKR